MNLEYYIDSEPSVHLKCRYPRCDSPTCVHSENGYCMAFCKEHSLRLPPKQFKQLSKLAEFSVFDKKNAARAEAAVRSAIRYINAGTMKG